MKPSFDMTRRAALHFLSATPVFLGAGSTLAASASNVVPSFAVSTPIHVQSVTLRVRNLMMMAGFYNQIMGLDVIHSDATSATLGKDGVSLLQLFAKPDDEPDDPTTAGLFHTAFLMPNREELGRWLMMAVINQIPFVGFADHRVSEALYLNDPEGNGLEVYADRPREGWQWQGNQVVMGTEELDLENLVKDLPEEGALPYRAPAGFRIGHVHMRVGDTQLAQDFYVKASGLDLTALVGNASAAFFSNGRYHHHVGANIWQSRGAGQRPDNMSGLENASFAVDPTLMDGLRERLKAQGTDIAETGDVIEALDPWGTRIRFVPKT